MTEPEKLRALADFIEANPWLGFSLGTPICYVSETKLLIKAAKLPGAKKNTWPQESEWYSIDVPFCKDLYICVYTDRAKVCTAKKVERITEPARSYDKVIEWECHPLLEEFEQKAG